MAHSSPPDRNVGWGILRKKTMKSRVDELRKTMPLEEIKKTIHEWWKDYEIADKTEDNLLAYAEDGIGTE